MEEGKTIGKLFCDVEVVVNCKKELTHREKMDKLIDELDYLNTAEVESLLKTAETFKIKNEIGGIPTKDLVEELKRRVGVDTFEVTDEFTFTFPIPISCIVRNDDVFYNDCWIGKVNESDASKVDVCNLEFVSCNRDDEGIVFKFRQVE